MRQQSHPAIDQAHAYKGYPKYATGILTGGTQTAYRRGILYAIADQDGR